MLKTILFLFLAILNAQTSLPPLTIDVRPRLFRDDRLNVVVQIDNHTDRNILEMEGFITESDQEGKMVSEKRLILVRSYDPALKPEMTVSGSLSYPFKRTEPKNYTFHISRIRFSEDYRIYAYHPAIGFIRID